jgi:hypothetical protein
MLPNYAVRESVSMKTKTMQVIGEQLFGFADLETCSQVRAMSRN